VYTTRKLVAFKLNIIILLHYYLLCLLMCVVLSSAALCILYYLSFAMQQYTIVPLVIRTG